MRGFTLATAMLLLEAGATVRRANWRGRLIVANRPSGRVIVYVWWSGDTHVWWPTPEDLVASDWRAA